jgi:predicted O-linked N-acetylglucosamine transferase (SPINDLY family)
MSADDEFPIDRPVAPAYDVFDRTPVADSLKTFLYQSVVEFNFDRKRHSTFFGGVEDRLVDHGLRNPEHTARFERSAILTRARNGSPLQLDKSARVFDDTPDNRNTGFWRNAGKEGFLFSISDTALNLRSGKLANTDSNAPRLEELTRRVHSLQSSGSSAAALAEAERCIALHPASAELLNLAAAAAMSLGESSKAEKYWLAAIRAESDYVDAYSNLALLFFEEGRFEEAASLCLRAIEILPTHANALNHLGLALMATGRSIKAEKAFRQALSSAPDHADALNNLGLLLKGRGNLTEAEAVIRQALRLAPTHARAHNNLGVVLLATRQGALAAASLKRAVEISPGFADAHNNLGLALLDSNQLQAAEEAFEKALTLDPRHPIAMMNLGVLQKKRGRYAAAEALFRRSMEFSADNGNAAGEAYFCARYLCDWTHKLDDESQLTSMIHRGVSNISPFIFLTIDNPSIPNMAALQLQAATLYSREPCRLAEQHPAASRPAPRHRHAVLRVGYLSSDFHEHATMHLLRGVLRAHDRSKFAIYGFSYGTIHDSMTEQAKAACSVFRDISGLSDLDAAQLISADEIDILVDLKGFTLDSRPEISALRPAPIIVSWLGYPGSLGDARLADYIIGDPIVTPPDAAEFFTERIVTMPHCYQPNDRERPLPKTPSRAQAGLPENAFVFCCFNASYKITGEVFGVWCRLLAVVPDSVLWLLDAPPEAVSNLRSEAERRNIASQRLIFAPTKSLSEHLARLQLADLALDTFPYTSHTTASDALWAVVPLVTRIGDTFPSRVAASLLHSIGLPDLITNNMDDYYSLAKQLATNPEALTDVKDRLATGKLDNPLFNTEEFTKELEKLYIRIWNES